MSANWDLGTQFSNGVSLAARIAGQVGQQNIERERNLNEKNYQTGELENARTRTGNEAYYQAEEAGNAQAKIANEMQMLPSQIKEKNAQADWMSGRNAAYKSVGEARASAMAAKTAAGGLADLQRQIKDYDQMQMIDPQGDKGIYTPQKAQEHAALLNAFSLKQGIAMPPAPNGGVAPAKPGLMSEVGQGIGAGMGMVGRMAGFGPVMDYMSGGGSPPPAAAAPPPAAGVYRNPQTGHTIRPNAAGTGWEDVPGQ